jgi:hypothetical protein
MIIKATCKFFLRKIMMVFWKKKTCHLFIFLFLGAADLFLFFLITSDKSSTEVDDLWPDCLLISPL